MFSFLYNKLYKKLSFLLIVLFFGLPYLNKVPYPLFLDIPRYDEIKITDEWKNLKYPCFKVETMSGNWLLIILVIFIFLIMKTLEPIPDNTFGKEITDYKEKVLIGYGDHMYSLIQPINKCIKAEINNSETHENTFRVLGAVKSQTCQLHAPNIQSECKSSYLVKSCSYSKTGSMTGLNPCTMGLFGLFDLDEVGLSIVPLKYFEFFEDKNDAFNYIWLKENKSFINFFYDFSS